MARITPSTVELRDGMAITLRSAELGDAPALIEHRRHSVLNSEHSVTQPDELDCDIDKQREWITNHLERDGWIVIVAIEHAGGLVGAISFENGHNRRVVAHHGHFGISVHADWRSRGVGTALILALLDWARAQPVIEKVCLGVLANNHGAQRLYQRLGFVEEGRRAREFKFGPDNYIDDIQMYQFVK